MNLSYKPEIDGLRAVAVVAVIINHFNQSVMPSGYLGVDIFFVISGYVITRSLIGRSPSGVREFFLGFYSRRLKRLAPALVLCVAVTLAAIGLFNDEPWLHVKTGLFSLAGLSNIVLYQNDVDYWSQDSRLNPFTHTWSLGVEEQFYFIYPALMWLMLGTRRSPVEFGGFFRLNVVLVVLSFAGFVYIYDFNQPAAYYLPFFRYWELGLGCLAALLVARVGQPVWVAMANRLHGLVLALLVAVFFLPPSFAVWNTAGAVLLATVLLLLVSRETPGRSILSSLPVVYVGKISYSLYLWHWPVIVISLWTVGLHIWTLPFQIAAIVALSVLSYHYVESPLRHMDWFTPTRGRVALVGAAVASIGLFTGVAVASSKGLLYLGDADKGSAGTQFARLAEACPSAAARKPKIVRTIGNSHSRHILPMLNQLAKQCNLRVRSETGPNFILVPSGEGLDKSLVRKALEPMGSGDILIVSNRNRQLYKVRYLNARGTRWLGHANEKRAIEFGLRNWLVELDYLLEQAQARGVHIVLLLPNVEFDSNRARPPEAFCKEAWFRVVSERCVDNVSWEFLQSRFPKEFYASVSSREKRFSNFHVFDPLPIYCPQRTTCSRMVKGVYAFRDTNHLSHDGALLMLDEFAGFLAKRDLLD